jgi:hypothetical protein
VVGADDFRPNVESHVRLVVELANVLSGLDELSAGCREHEDSFAGLELVEPCVDALWLEGRGRLRDWLAEKFGDGGIHPV